MSCTNRVIKVTETDAIVRLGVWDTDNVREQKFDFSAWAEAFGPGNLLIIAQRKTDEIPYEVAQVAISGNVATWIFDEADTAIPGYGSVALAYIVGEEYKARTVPYQTYTAPTIGMTGPVPPDPWESWFSRVLEASSDAKDAAAAAAASASDALSYATDAGGSAAEAAGSATDAADSALAAAGSASDAQSAADGAAGSAEEAGGFADAAFQSKEAAEDAAGRAADSASGAADSADAAAGSATEAAESAAAASAAAAALVVTGANVGDVIRVASVDANGKPTAWTPEAVDAAPTQGSAAIAASGGIYDAIVGLLPTASASGDVVTVADGADGVPVKELTITTGYLSDGASSMALLRAGKNLYAPGTIPAHYSAWNNYTFVNTPGLVFLRAGTYVLSAPNVSGMTEWRIKVRAYTADGTLIQTSAACAVSYMAGSDLSVWGFRSDLGNAFFKTVPFFSGGLKVKIVLAQDSWIAMVNGTTGSSPNSFAVPTAQLEYGTAATAYAAYVGQTYEITLPDGFYGGSIDLIAKTATLTYTDDGQVDPAPAVLPITLSPGPVTTLLGANTMETTLIRSGATVIGTVGTVAVTYRRDLTLALEEVAQA